MLVVLLVILYPLYFTIIASFSEPAEVAAGNVYLWPKGFTIEAYQHLLEYKAIWRGYANTIYYTVLGTLATSGIDSPRSHLETALSE